MGPKKRRRDLILSAFSGGFEKKECEYLRPP